MAAWAGLVAGFMAQSLPAQQLEPIAATEIAVDWKQVKHKGHVLGSVRPKAKSDMREFKVETVIDAPVLAVTEYLTQPSTWPAWIQAGTEAFYLLPSAPDSGVVCYASIPLPFGMKTREMAMGSTFGRFSNWGVVATHRSLDNFPLAPNPPADSTEKPEKPRVRMNYEAVLVARETSPGKTEINYQGTMRYNGNIPRAYTNFVMVKRPFRMISSLKKAVERK